MKIINRLTLRYLKENKKRSILTILCISLSVIMISCVGIAFYSGKQFYKDYIEKTIGDYHYTVVDDKLKTIDIIKNDKQVKEYYFSYTENYFYKNKENYKESLTVKRGDSLYFEKKNFNENLLKGIMPKNPQEIILSENYLKKNNINKSIGDSITLQSIIIKGDKEIIKPHTFTIVGILKEFNLSGQGYYSAISYVDLKDNQFFSMYVKDIETSNNIFEHANILQDKIIEGRNIENQNGLLRFNSQYLGIQDIFESGSNSTFLIIYTLIATLLVIIVFISIFIIYQAFNLSTNDRVQYLGMLSSVGATPKQKKRSVYYEGFILSIIAIPLGIIISFIGLSVTFLFIDQMQMINDLNVKISASISLEYLIAVIIISLVTIFLSLYLPARKISKISIIEALKKNDEIKISSKKLKRGFISKKFFHIHQQLALKNYKRQGRRSKVIVFSLVVSMMAFVGINSFGNNMSREISKSQKLKKYDISLNISDNLEQNKELRELLDKNEKVDSYFYSTSINAKSKVDKSYFSEQYKMFELVEEDVITTYIGITMDIFKKICRDNNIEYKENMALVINQTIYLNNEGFRVYDKSIDKNFIKSSDYYETDNNNKEIRTPLPLFDYIDLLQNDDYGLSTEYGINMIVPIDYVDNVEKSVYGNYQYYITSKDNRGLEEDLLNADYSCYNYGQSVEQQRQMNMIIQIFIYGFVFIMIIFTVLNIINMMSASIDKRKKEFAMILSVGMSPKGIKKMILNESLIYGLKTLLYGIPLSILTEYFIYIQTYGSNNIEIPFQVSYISYLIIFIVIMLVMVLTFRVGLRQLQKQNIVETLKDDM